MLGKSCLGCEAVVNSFEASVHGLQVLEADVNPFEVSQNVVINGTKAKLQSNEVLRIEVVHNGVLRQFVFCVAPFDDGSCLPTDVCQFFLTVKKLGVVMLIKILLKYCCISVESFSDFFFSNGDETTDNFVVRKFFVVA